MLLASAAKLSWFGVQQWPASVPAQVHYATEDPYREEDELRSFRASVHDSGAPLEFYEYSSRGHLFDDVSLADEYDDKAAGLMWKRVLDFVARTETLAASD